MLKCYSDKACHQFYELSANGEKDAEDKLLSEIWEINQFIYPLFQRAFHAKKLYEHKYHRPYDSFMYFEYDRFSTEPLLRMYKHVIKEKTNGEGNTFLKIEQQWMGILQQIWKGYCEVAVASPHIIKRVKNIRLYCKIFVCIHRKNIE
jgi:hypothetical protein